MFYFDKDKAINIREEKEEITSIKSWILVFA
jgi:hypothetical protein